MVNILSALHAGVDTQVGDRIMNNALARDRERMEQTQIREQNALRKVVGNALANEDFKGGQKAAFAGGDIKGGMDIGTHMANQTAAERKRFVEGLNTAASLAQRGVTGPRMIELLSQGGFVDDDEDAQFFGSATPDELMGLAGSASKEGEKFGMAPTFFTDESGQLVVGQLGNKGTVRFPNTGGLKPLSPFEKASQLEAGKQIQRNIHEPARAGNVERERTSAELNTRTRLEPELVQKKEVAKAEGQASGKAPERLRKVRASLDSFKAKTGIVKSEIDRLIQEVEGQTDLAPVTGFGGARLSGVEGSAAFNARGRVQTIQSNIAFNELQEMRQNSPTGGAVGQLSDSERVALGSTLGNINLDQKKEQVLQQLRQVKRALESSESRLEGAFRKDQKRFGLAEPDGGGEDADPLGLFQ